VAADVSRIRDMGQGVIGSLRMYEGDDLDDARIHRVGITRGLGEKLGLSIGSQASVMATTMNGLVNAVDVEVAQWLDAQFEILDTMLMSVPFALARELYQTDGADRLIVVLRDPRTLPAVLRDLQTACTQQGLKVEIRSWQELRLSYARVRNMFNVIFVFMFTIVMVIVLLSVINTVSMSVMERTREIGTLRSLGVKRQGLVSIFAIESALLGLAGSAAGIVLTLAGWAAIAAAKPTWIPPNIPKRVPLEIHLVPEYLATSLLFFVALAIVASFVPTRRALRLSIVDALGHT
jgi:putative ABC transport system permease protein